MFSLVSVILFTGGMYPSMHWADIPLGQTPPTPTPWADTPWSNTPPPRQTPPYPVHAGIHTPCPVHAGIHPLPPQALQQTVCILLECILVDV